MDIQERVKQLWGQETTENTSRKKARQVLERINPFLDDSGKVKYKNLNYQKLLNSDRTSNAAKRFIQNATGLTPSRQYEQETTQNTAPATTQGVVAVNAAVKPQGSNKIGFISSKYEVGGWNPGRVSSGAGDYGGISYGIPQFSTTTGSADKFVNWVKQTSPEIGKAFGNSRAGSQEFSNAWKNVSNQYGDQFGEMQTAYAYQNFVQPLVNLAKQKTGIDYTRSPALKELIYSTAIQFGGGNLGLAALGNVRSDMSDRDIVNASYDKKISNVGNFFKSSSKAVQNGVKNRFANERNDVLGLLG